MINQLLSAYNLIVDTFGQPAQLIKSDGTLTVTINIAPASSFNQTTESISTDFSEKQFVVKKTDLENLGFGKPENADQLNLQGLEWTITEVEPQYIGINIAGYKIRCNE